MARKRMALTAAALGSIILLAATLSSCSDAPAGGDVGKLDGDELQYVVEGRVTCHEHPTENMMGTVVKAYTWEGENLVLEYQTIAESQGWYKCRLGVHNVGRDMRVTFEKPDFSIYNYDFRYEVPPINVMCNPVMLHGFIEENQP